MVILDDFLSEEKFKELQNLILGPYLPWNYNSVIDYADDMDKYQFVHGFYINNEPCSPYFHNLDPILEIIDPISVLRVKANLLTRTSNIIENSYHIDLFDDIPIEKIKQLTTSIFYLNSNNGYTKFEDNTKVNSIANRLITFPANVKHKGSTCTDENVRVVINFNYLK